MNTEELRIYLRTVADTSGATKTQQALRQTQTQAASFGRSLAGFAAFGAAAGAAGVGVTQLSDALGGSIDVMRTHERVMRATTMAYGQATNDWIKFAAKLSAQTGFTSDAVLESALSARTLSQNYGLSIRQTQKLIEVTADLARVRGIGLFEAFERVQSAIRGEAEASEYLGLTLGDVYMSTTAAEGAFKKTWGTMSDTAKAQERLNELLKQSVQFSGLAANSADSLDGAFGRAAVSANKLQLEIGKIIAPATIAGLNAAASAMDLIARGGVLGIAREELQKAASGGAGGGGEGGFREGEPFKEQQRAIYLTKEALEEYRAAQARLAAQQRRLLELNEMPVPAAESAARLAFLDQVDAAVRDLTSAQQRQLEVQREGVNLAAQEAQIRLGMLPAQQRMAELQRQMTEQQIAARRAALPATEALEDLRFAEQRARLIAANRGVSAAERIDARRQLRSIGRALPGAELAALEAGRPVTLAERAATRLGMEQQLFEISTQRQLQQITEAQTANGYLSTIAAQRTQAIELTINMSSEGIQQEIFKQLVEAEAQAQGPTTIRLSGVRRS